MKNIITTIATVFFGVLYSSYELNSAVIQIQSATFTPADGSFDISVILNNNSPSSLSLATFSLQLSITQSGSEQVGFDPINQPDTLSNPNYVFFGNSAAASDPFTPWTVNSVGTGTNNEYTFADLTSDTMNVTLSSGETRLLSEIRMTPGVGSFTPQPGSQFLVSVVTGGTSIYDELLNPVAFTSTSGTLSVSAIPEPSTYMLLFTGTVVLVLRNRFQRMPRSLK